MNYMGSIDSKGDKLTGAKKMSNITFPSTLSSSYESILANDNDMNWAIYTYDKGGHELKLAETGSGGLEELEQEFDEGKIQYAFARVKEPVSGLNKFVLISWCGDGVPVSRKGLFNVHVQDGFHVHVNARSRQDIEPQSVLKKVKDSSGAKYSIHKEKPMNASTPAPVGSTYQPIQTTPKPLNLTHTFQQSFDNRAELERERRENEERERRLADEKANKDRQEHEARRRAQQESELLEKEEKERQLRGSRVREERERREREELEREQAAQNERERQFQIWQEKAAMSSQRNGRIPSKRLIQAIPARPAPSAVKIKKAQVLYDYTAVETNEINLKEGEILEHIHELDEGWWQGTRSSGESGLFPANYVELLEESASATLSHRISTLEQREAQEQQRNRLQRERKENEELEAKRQREEQEKREREQQQQRENETRDASAHLTATALYDYQAAESNEINLYENEMIKDIVQVDADWWQGTNSLGQTGLFPANYVELNHPVAAPPLPTRANVHLDRGIEARALYDYDAAEENEISFREGDVITHIEFPSDEWWQVDVMDRIDDQFHQIMSRE